MIAELQARSIMALGIETYGREACEAWARMGRQVRHTLLDGGTFFVAERDGGLIGVAGWVADSREADCAWPRYVFVSPAAAGGGTGRKLMQTVEQSVHAAGRTRLKLWASLNAVGFYERLGYRQVKPARWPVADGIEMEHRLMAKSLDPRLVVMDRRC
ncbi:MAG: GNAT family N-acetyltransferase [Alphaproteobacteria bacterium]|nr:GNAT family N-acetyltransferase [Alphaproteobacteria bacterium]